MVNLTLIGTNCIKSVQLVAGISLNRRNYQSICLCSDAYAQMQKLRATAYDKMIDLAENAIEPLIIEKAQDYRKDNPGLGCAKLYLIIKKSFESTGCMPGRDAFIELLRSNGLMVQIKDSSFST